MRPKKGYSPPPVKYFLLAVVAAIAVALLASRCRGAEHWRWSPRADHHTAAVRVRVGGAGGSGVYVQHGRLKGVLTARHVIGGNQRCQVLWSDGRQSVTSRATTDKFGHDTAFLFCDHPTIQPLKVSTTGPRNGEWLEFMGHGGPESRRLRHFYGRAYSVTVDSQTLVNAPCISGDSGGGIINAQTLEVVGIQSTGRNGTRAYERGWPVYAHSGLARGVGDFVQRIATSLYPPGGSVVPMRPANPPRNLPSTQPIPGPDLAPRQPGWDRQLERPKILPSTQPIGGNLPILNQEQLEQWRQTPEGRRSKAENEAWARSQEGNPRETPGQGKGIYRDGAYSKPDMQPARMIESQASS